MATPKTRGERLRMAREQFFKSGRLAAQALNRVDAPLEADEAGDVPVIPTHEKGTFAGLRDDAIPRAAALVGGMSDTLERDVLGGADWQHDCRGCLRFW